MDSASKLPVAVLSTTGGVDVERSDDRCIVRRTFDPFVGLRAFEGRKMAQQLSIMGKTMNGIGAVLHQLADAFIRLDGVTFEINPLAETTDGALIGIVRSRRAGRRRGFALGERIARAWFD